MLNRTYFYLFLAMIFCWISITCAEEKINFGKPIKPITQESEMNQLPLSSESPSRKLADGAEIIIISGYEPSDAGTYGTRAKVVINRPKSKVLLVLTSYEKITWEVVGSPQTKIVGIVVAGYKKPTVVTTVKTVGYLSKLPYSYETENSKFKELLAKLNQLFGITKIDVFRGKYTIPSLTTISELDRPHAELTLTSTATQIPEVNFSFNLVGADFKNSKWSLLGPSPQILSNEMFTLSKDGDFLYKAVDDGIEITNFVKGNHSLIRMPSNFPSFSWLTGITFDTKREIVTITTLGGEGFLYRFDVKNKNWIDFRSLHNVDILSLSYDFTSDRYVGWTSAGELIFISNDGEALFTKKVIDKLSGFGRLYDRGNESSPRITIAPNGNDIALIYIFSKTVRNIWYYSLTSETAIMSYQNEDDSPRRAQ